MRINTAKAVSTVAIAAAVAVAVYATKDGAYLWGLVTLLFVRDY